MLQEVRRRVAAGEWSDVALLDANYLRRTDAEIKLGSVVASREGLGLVVRAAQVREDLVALVELEKGAATAPHWSAGEYARIVAGEGVRRCLLVGEDDGELLGFGVGRVVGEEAELESVVVREGARRRGVGKALCKAVMAWAWAEGAAVMELEVRVGSAGAVRLYEGLGFSEVGRRRKYYAEPVEDAVLMRCGLRGEAVRPD